VGLHGISQPAIERRGRDPPGPALVRVERERQETVEILAGAPEIGRQAMPLRSGRRLLRPRSRASAVWGALDQIPFVGDHEQRPLGLGGAIGDRDDLLLERGADVDAGRGFRHAARDAGRGRGLAARRRLKRLKQKAADRTSS
jgi:hypothetical protein